MSLVNSTIRLTRVKGSVRPMAIAGSFYPAAADELQSTVRRLLQHNQSSTPAPKAIIAPHAGYVYSGSIAAKAYGRLAQAKNKIKRVVLLGPAHRVPLRGIALSTHTHFATPLGNIAIDQPGLARIRPLPYAQDLEAAHEQEHSLEVQLPFLQMSLEQFTLVPLVVGQTTPEQVKQVLQQLWGGEETLIVVSTDLSHFHDYATATAMDQQTSAAIKALQLEKIGPQQACGCMPLRGLLALAREQDMDVTVLGTINSGDTAGSPDHVVGYGAYTVTEKPYYSHRQQERLLKLAWQTMQTGLESGKKIAVNPEEFDDVLLKQRATFVSLNKGGKLRGCMGTTEAVEPLLHSVINSAWNAAFQDPRFPPLTKSELEKIDLHLSILTPAQAMRFVDEADLISQLRPGVDGLIIRQGSHQATFLPSVWESLAVAEEFLGQLKQKAGIQATNSVEQAWRYQTQSLTSHNHNHNDSTWIKE